MLLKQVGPFASWWAVVTAGRAPPSWCKGKHYLQLHKSSYWISPFLIVHILSPVTKEIRPHRFGASLEHNQPGRGKSTFVERHTPWTLPHIHSWCYMSVFFLPKVSFFSVPVHRSLSSTLLLVLQECTL